MLLAPTVNLHRTPYGGRHFECFSEDPLLTARIGAAYVRGRPGRRRGRDRQALRGQRLRDRALHASTRGSTSARCASSTWRRSRRSSREARRVGGHGRLQRRQRHHDDREPDAARHPQGRVGLRRRRDVRLVRRPLDRGGRQRRRSTWSCPARRARGATRWSHAVRDGRVSEAAVDDKVLRLLRLAARVGALDGVEPAAPPARPWSQDEVRRRAARGGGRGLRPAAQRGRAAAARAGADLRRVAVIGPNAARRGPSAAAAPPSSRRTRSRRWRGCAPRSGRRRRSSTRPACAPTRGSLAAAARAPAGRRRGGPLPRRRRHRAGHRARRTGPPSPGWARSARTWRRRGGGRRGPRAAARAGRGRATSSAASGVGPLQR